MTDEGGPLTAVHADGCSGPYNLSLSGLSLSLCLSGSAPPPLSPTHTLTHSHAHLPPNPHPIHALAHACTSAHAHARTYTQTHATADSYTQFTDFHHNKNSETPNSTVCTYGQIRHALRAYALNDVVDTAHITSNQAPHFVRSLVRLRETHV